MKNWHILILATVLALTLTACSVGYPRVSADALRAAQQYRYSTSHHGCHRRGPHYHW